MSLSKNSPALSDLDQRSDDPIRVLHLLYTMAYGGVETVIINWLRTLDRKHVDPRLVIFSNPDQSEKPFCEAAQAAQLTVETIPWSRYKPVFQAVSALVRICKAHRVEVIHTHNAYANLVGWIAARRLGIRVLSTVYVWDGPGFGIRRRLLQWLDAGLLRFFDKVTAQCRQTMDESRQFGLDPAAMDLLPSGFSATPAKLSLAQRTALRTERGISPEQVVVCNVARFYPEKAQAFMLRCWKRVVVACPQARLWIYGVGPLENDLLSLRDKLGLQQSVSFLGFASHLATELELCDIQLHPSFAEGVPIAVCSGMAAGLPVLATRVGGLPEVIEHGSNGILVPVSDEDGLVRELTGLISTPSRRRSLGEAARRFIEQEYSLEAAGEKLCAVYRAMLGRTLSNSDAECRVAGEEGEDRPL